MVITKLRWSRVVVDGRRWLHDLVKSLANKISSLNSCLKAYLRSKFDTHEKLSYDLTLSYEIKKYIKDHDLVQHELTNV